MKTIQVDMFAVGLGASVLTQFALKDGSNVTVLSDGGMGSKYPADTVKTKLPQAFGSFADHECLRIDLIIGTHYDGDHLDTWRARSQQRRLACLLWSSPAWKMAARDSWVDWTNEERAHNLQLVVHNSRFLILPWVRYLASRRVDVVEWTSITKPGARVKRVYIYPLCRDVQRRLADDLAPRWIPAGKGQTVHGCTSQKSEPMIKSLVQPCDA